MHSIGGLRRQHALYYYNPAKSIVLRALLADYNDILYFVSIFRLKIICKLSVENFIQRIILLLFADEMMDLGM